jgi:hypothetical protein
VRRQASWIKQQLSNGNFRLSLHAGIRLGQRFITESDIIACGRTSKSIVFQEDRQNWKVVGTDLDGMKLTVVCDIRDGLIIVTVF